MPWEKIDGIALTIPFYVGEWKMLEFKYMPISNRLQFSSQKRKLSSIRFIVIHDTGNRSAGADAMAHYRYLNHAKRYGSAHYYVDDKQIIQTIGDSLVAWSVGDMWARRFRTRSDVTNWNSLNVEMCINRDGDYEKTWENTVELVKNLLIVFPQCEVVRHFDATGKPCPGSMRAENWKLWDEFLSDIKQPMKLRIDLSKSSVAKAIEEKPKVCPTCGQVLEKEDVKEVSGMEFKRNNYLNVIKVPSTEVYCYLMQGKTLRQKGWDGINGTFFDMGNAYKPSSVWGIAVENGRPIGPNADRVSYNPKMKRGTLCIDNDGNVSVQVVNNVNEIKPKARFAVSGLSLSPHYDPVGETVAGDILRRTWHTAIGFKDKDVYLITSRVMCDMRDFKRYVEALGVDGAVALDGGGSTEFSCNGIYQGSGRGLASAIKVGRKKENED